MAVVRLCSREDCKTLTMGEYCIEHERELDAALFSGLERTATQTPAYDTTFGTADAYPPAGA